MTTFVTSGSIWSISLSALLFIIATYFVTYYLVYLRQIKRWEQSNIPFLEPTFLVGHKYFSRAAKYSIAVPFDRIYKENADKDLIGFFLGPIPMIMLKDQKLIRQAFAKNYRKTFATGFALPESEEEAQYLITVTLDEERWKLARTIMTPVFSLNWFQGPMFERIRGTIDELRQDAEKIELDGSPMNVGEVVKNAILNLTSSHFGIDSHSPSMKNGIQTIMKDFFQPSFRRLLVFFSGSILPFLQMFESFKLMPRKLCDIMSEILKHQINQRDQMNIETGDLIDLFRSLRTKKELKTSSNQESTLSSINEGLTKRQMTGLGLLLVVGGSDTVQGLLQFAIHTLSLYPEYQRKVRREVHEAMKKHGVSDLTFEVVRSLPFTYRCLYETLRLYPIPMVMRQCLEDFQIPGTNYTLRKGDRLILPMYSLGRDEIKFQEPHSFNPDRFISEDTHLAVPGSLMSFGAGARKCPGYAHGVFATAALLASLLYKYEIKPRSHLKLMDAPDFKTMVVHTSPRKDIIVDLVRCENQDYV